MRREIIKHKVNACNDMLKIEALDEPGVDGACHSYAVTPTAGNALGICIDFQKGPMNETIYPNGLTQEVLLAIVIDRLEGFQKGPYACRENALALTKIEEAMHWLHHRTNKRLARGVEGTHTV